VGTDYILEKLPDASGPGLVEAGRYTTSPQFHHHVVARGILSCKIHILRRGVRLFLVPGYIGCSRRGPGGHAASVVPLSKGVDEEPTKRKI